jgi:hypothetical protein
MVVQVQQDHKGTMVRLDLLVRLDLKVLKVLLVALVRQVSKESRVLRDQLALLVQQDRQDLREILVSKVLLVLKVFRVHLAPLVLQVLREQTAQFQDRLVRLVHKGNMATLVLRVQQDRLDLLVLQAHKESKV